MDRHERFYRLTCWIRSRGCVSFAELSSAVEVSRATLKRDLQYLRVRMDAPIVYDRFESGYRLQADHFDRLQVQHNLPGVWFREPEILALMTMDQLMEGLDDSELLARLYGMLGDSHSDAKQMAKRVRIANAGRRAVPSRWFGLVGDALLKRRRLHMQYRMRSRGHSILVFSAETAQWVRLEEWHPQQAARWLPDCRFELRVPYVDATELTTDCLRHGEHVVVDSPKKLRETVAKMLGFALANYSADDRAPEAQP